MEFAALLVFVGAVTIAAASPGPAITALVARVIGRGVAGVPAFISGIIVGDLAWLAMAVLGLSVLAHSFEMAFAAAKYAGAAYLLYLGWRMWGAPVRQGDAVVERGALGLRSFLGGLMLTLGNPKTIAFYVALMPTLIDLHQLNPAGCGELATAAVAANTVVLCAYTLAAGRARKLFRSPGAMRVLNRTGGALLVGAGITVAAR